MCLYFGPRLVTSLLLGPIAVGAEESWDGGCDSGVILVQSVNVRAGARYLSLNPAAGQLASFLRLSYFH